MTATSEQLRKFRTQGFQDGYHGRAQRWTNPVYRNAHWRGTQKRLAENQRRNRG